MIPNPKCDRSPGLFEPIPHRVFTIHSLLSNTESERLDIEFLFEVLQQFIADYAIISQSDYSLPLSC
jgi:hypothetical protein